MLHKQKQTTLVYKQQSLSANSARLSELTNERANSSDKVSCAWGVQDPYRIRKKHPVTLLNHNVAGLEGRYIEDMRVVRVLFFRVGTERAGLVGLRDVFTKPELVKIMFG